MKYYDEDLRELLKEYGTKDQLGMLPPLEFNRGGVFSKIIGMEDATSYIQCEETPIDWEDTVEEFCETIQQGRREDSIYLAD